MTNTVDLIAQYEGYSATPYWDHGQWSVGYGSYAGSRDRNNPPNVTVSRSEARTMLQQQLGKYEASVDKYDSTYNWTPAERQAMTSFAYNIGSLDQVTANGTRSKEEVSQAMLLYNKASGETVPGLVDRRNAEYAIFTGGEAPTTRTAPPPQYSGPGSTSGTGGSDAPLPNAEPGTNFNTAGSLSDIVTQMENAGEWWENALDEYQNYTYHLELFVVKQQDAVEFLMNEAQDLDSIISNSWPGSDIQYITIAETGVTTEFNIQDLEIQSLGAGSSSVSRLAGTATKLSFSIVQVGNTSLNDNLMNAALLSGYASIAEAKYFLKVNFKGYSDDGVTIRSENQNLTKVFPFVISNVGDVPSSTDARGTITTIDGTITPDYAVSRSVNLIQHNFEFDIKETLKETIEEFFSKLNENIQKNDFSTDNAAENQYIHTYEFEFDNDFMTEFGESKMNGDEPNVGGAARNQVATRTGSVNISQQTGVITSGLSVIDVLYDICIQSIDIRTELTTEKDTFTKTVSILPDASPKPNGLNPLSGEAGHNVKYFITTKNQIVVQNNYDNANKITNSAKMVKEIFDRQQCKKIYYYQYTGLNDQILDLNISLNRQLIKAYNLPKDDAFAQRFIEGNEQIIQDLNPRAKAKLEELQSQLSILEGDRTAANKNLDSIRSQVENSSEELTNAIVIGQQDELLARGVPPEIARQTAEALRDKPLQAQLQAAQQYDPDILNTTSEEREKYNKLLERYNSAGNRVNTVDTSLREIEGQVDKVTMQALGANFSAYTNSQVSDISENFSGIAGQLSNSNQIIMEELGDDLISTLTTQQLEDIVEALLVNPVIFKRGILPYLTEKNNIRIYTSSNEKEVDLAKEKFYEAVNMDISMEQLKLTIKGDPYWIDTYLTPKTAKELFGNSNAIDTYRSHPTSINGANYVTIVSNKAAGVDENDNTKIANLVTMLYAVRNVTSSFSNGQFVQQLDMIRIPVPDSFLPVNPFFSTSSVDLDEETVMGQQVGTANDGSGFRSLVPGLFDPRGRDQIGDGGNGTGGSTIDLGDGIGNSIGSGRGGDPRLFANNAFSSISGSISTLAGKIADSPFPSASDSARYASLINQASMAAAYGSNDALSGIESANKTISDSYGNPEEVSSVLQELVDNGENVSPEAIAMLKNVYEDPDTIVTPTQISDDAVFNVMEEVQTLNDQNFHSADEIAADVSGHMTSSIDPVSVYDTPPSLILLENSNMMLDGTLPLLSTETYTSSTPPVVDYNIEQLEALDLPEDVVSGYKDAAATRNGIKVRKYIDSLPQNQADLLDSIDSPYVLKTQPAIEVAPTIEEVASTPLKTPREEIMQARIQDAQTQMIAEAGGSYNDLSDDEKRHYENLSDAYDEIDEIANNDPIRNEAKLKIINDELDKSIRIYNDRLSGGDSEWSWTQKEAEDKEQLEIQNDTTVLENISNLDNAHSTPIADRVIVDNNGNVNIMKDMSVLPTKPSDGFSLPIDYLSENDEFEITDEHLAQYELAENNWNDFRKGEYVTVTVVDDNPLIGTYETELYSSFDNPELAQRYGIDTTPLQEGEVITADDPRYIQWNVGNLSDIRNKIANELPLVTTVDTINSQVEGTKKLEVDIGLNGFVLLEGQGE